MQPFATPVEGPLEWALAWLLVIGLLVACWLMSQAWRHPELSRVAAFLLFSSVGALVQVAVFTALAWLLTLFTPDRGAGTGATVVMILVAALSGAFAGRWIVRRPQRRQSPR